MVLIWLKVNIAGKSKPLNFLLDSGAGISAIDLRTARTLGVLLGSRQTVLGVRYSDRVLMLRPFGWALA
jgi:hypothetical protein